MNKHLILVLVVAALVIILASGVFVATRPPSFEENQQFFLQGGAVAQYEKEIVARAAAFDVLRQGTPATVVDVSRVQTLMTTFSTEAILLSEEMDLIKKVEGDTASIEKAMGALRERYDAILLLYDGRFTEAEEAVVLYKEASGLPMYNPPQQEALSACGLALAEGGWQEAKKQCQLAKERAIPSTMTPTATVLPTMTPLPTDTTSQ